MCRAGGGPETLLSRSLSDLATTASARLRGTILPRAPQPCDARPLQPDRIRDCPVHGVVHRLGCGQGPISAGSATLRLHRALLPRPRSSVESDVRTLLLALRLGHRAEMARAPRHAA